MHKQNLKNKLSRTETQKLKRVVFGGKSRRIQKV